MTFHVGQRVVCITDDWEPEPGIAPSPDVRKGHVYTVQAIVNRGYPAIILCEVSSRNWYAQSGFRPAVERKTDIAVFQAMLIDKKVTVNA
jgi:hypothetical protein